MMSIAAWKPLDSCTLTRVNEEASRRMALTDQYIADFWRKKQQKPPSTNRAWVWEWQCVCGGDMRVAVDSRNRECCAAVYRECCAAVYRECCATNLDIWRHSAASIHPPHASDDSSTDAGHPGDAIGHLEAIGAAGIVSPAPPVGDA